MYKKGFIFNEIFQDWPKFREKRLLIVNLHVLYRLHWSATKLSKPNRLSLTCGKKVSAYYLSFNNKSSNKNEQGIKVSKSKTSLHFETYKSFYFLYIISPFRNVNFQLKWLLFPILIQKQFLQVPEYWNSSLAYTFGANSFLLYE